MARVDYSFPGHVCAGADFGALVAALRKHRPAEISLTAGGSDWAVGVTYSEAFGDLASIYFETIVEFPPGGDEREHPWVRLNLATGKYCTATHLVGRGLPPPFRLSGGSSQTDVS